MKITKKIWLLRICTVLYTAIFCIGCVATDGVLQDVYASSANTVLVKKTKADKESKARCCRWRNPVYGCKWEYKKFT